mgnify:CR=1 FL=1
MKQSITSETGDNTQADSNRRLWNNLASIHPQTKFYDVDGFIEGRCSLTEIEQDVLGDIAGKKVLHLQCHFGLETLSMARRGAAVTGVDFSDVAVRKARALNDQLKLDAQFVCCDVNELDQYLDDKYDLVFASFGVIGWHCDLGKWARIVAHFMKDGGRFCFAEFHPVLWMLSDDHKRFEYSYFKGEVLVVENEGSYADPDATDMGTAYSWNHSLSELFQALEDHGLVIRDFREYDYSPYPCFQDAVGENGRYRIKDLEKTLPLAYSLSAMKELRASVPAA